MNECNGNTRAATFCFCMAALALTLLLGFIADDAHCVSAAVYFTFGGFIVVSCSCGGCCVKCAQAPHPNQENTISNAKKPDIFAELKSLQLGLACDNRNRKIYPIETVNESSANRQTSHSIEQDRVPGETNRSVAPLNGMEEKKGWVITIS